MRNLKGALLAFVLVAGVGAGGWAEASPDCNGDGLHNIEDVVCLYQSGGLPDCNGDGLSNIADMSCQPLVFFGPTLMNGDGNGDGRLDISDVWILGNYLFGSGPQPALVDAAVVSTVNVPPGTSTPLPLPTSVPLIDNGDLNGDGTLDISDLVYFVDYLFGGGSAPVAITVEPAVFML